MKQFADSFPVSSLNGEDGHEIKLPQMLAESWNVFLNVEAPDDFSKVPAMLKASDGTRVSPQTVKLKDNAIDLAELAGKFNVRDMAILYHEFYSMQAGVMQFGASADWWMVIYLNGKQVYSTESEGNGSSEFLPSDHILTLPVKKGWNLLAVRVQSGSDGWMFVCGNPTSAMPSNEIAASLLADYRAEWALLRPKLDAEIARCRQGDAELKIVDEQGRDLVGAKVKIRQQTHEFLFGCNILPLGQLGEKNTAYEQAFVKLFNLATTTFCWSAIEPEPGELRFAEGTPDIWRRPPPDRVVAFAKKHGLALKGQPLLCDNWCPRWAPKEPEALKRLWRDYFRKVAERYDHDFLIWDVVNESQCCAARFSDFPLYTPDLNYVDWSFKAAAPFFSINSLLEINEGSNVNGGLAGNRYLDQIQGLLKQGTDIRSIGMQFHLFALRRHLSGRLFPPAELLTTYHKFNALGLPLFISEVTIPASLGEDIQAEVLDNLYHLWFSIPNMNGIIYWNLNDGAAWKNEGKAQGGLLDDDFMEKPAYQRLYQLIHRHWKTRIEAQTNEQGELRFRGFYGKYAVTVSVGEETRTFDFDLTKSGKVFNQLVFARGEAK